MDSFNELSNSNKFIASSFPANSSQMNPHFHPTNPANSVSKTSDLIADSLSSQKPLDLFVGTNTAAASNMFPVDGVTGCSQQSLTQGSGSNVQQHGQSMPLHGQNVQEHGQNVPVHEQSVHGHGQSVPGHRQNVLGHKENMQGHEQSMPEHGHSIPGHGHSMQGYGQSVPGHGQSLPVHEQSIPGHGHPSAFTAVKPKQANEQSSFASFSSDSIEQQMKAEFSLSDPTREDGTNKTGPTLLTTQSQQQVTSFPPAQDYISDASQPERYSEEQSSLVLDPRPHDLEPNTVQSDHHVRRDYPHAHGMDLSHERHRSRGSQDSLVSPKQQTTAPFPSRQPGGPNYSEESISSASTENSSKSVIDNRPKVPLATDNAGQYLGYQDVGSQGVSAKDAMQDIDFTPQNQSSPAHAVRQNKSVPKQTIMNTKQAYPNEAMHMHPNTAHNGAPAPQDQLWHQGNTRDDRQDDSEQKSHMPAQKAFENPNHISTQMNANLSGENDFRAEPSNNYHSSAQPQHFDPHRNVEQSESRSVKHKGHENKVPANPFGIKLFGQNDAQQTNSHSSQHAEKTGSNPHSSFDRHTQHPVTPQTTSSDLGQSNFPRNAPLQPPMQPGQNISQHSNSASQVLHGFQNEGQPQKMPDLQQRSHTHQEPYSSDIQQPPALQKYPSKEQQIESTTGSEVPSQPSQRQIQSQEYQERNASHHFQEQPGQQSKNAPQSNLVPQEQPSQRQMITQNDQYEQMHQNENPVPKNQISEQSQPIAQQRDLNSQQFEGLSVPQSNILLQQQDSVQSQSGPSSLDRSNRLSDLGLRKAPAQVHLPQTHQGQQQVEGSSSQQQLQEPSIQQVSHNQFIPGQQPGQHRATGQGPTLQGMQAQHGINQPPVPQNHFPQNQPMRDHQPTSQQLETNQPMGQQVIADGRLSQPDHDEITGQAQPLSNQYQPPHSSQQLYPQQQAQHQSLPQQQLQQQQNIQYPQQQQQQLPNLPAQQQKQNVPPQQQQQNLPQQQQQQNLPQQQQQQNFSQQQQQQNVSQRQQQQPNLPVQQQKHNLPPQQQQQNLPQQQQQQNVSQQQQQQTAPLQQQQYPQQQIAQQQSNQQYPQQQTGYNQQYPNQQQQQQNQLPPQQLQQQQYPHQQQQFAQQQQQQIQQHGQFPQQQYGQHGAQYYAHQHSQGDPSQRFDNMSPALPMQQQMPNYPDQNQMHGWNPQYGGYPQNYNYEYYNWYWANYGYGGYPQYPGAYPGMNWDARSHHSDQMSYSSSRNPSEVDVDSRPSSVIDNRPLDDYEIESLEMSKKEISTFERSKCTLAYVF